MKITLSIDFSKPNKHDYSVLSIINTETNDILSNIKLDKMPEQSEQDEIKELIKSSIFDHVSGIKRRLSASPLEQWMIKHGS
jgi:hypothetical protein